MNDAGEKSLLPEGLRDALPPDAEFEARVIEDVLGQFGAAGYERVKPPLVEFEDSLLSGSGAEHSPYTFRIMDPVSGRMMGVRADMTIQIARIGMSRLANAPRPLRLCYAGDVLRVRGSQLRPQRQFVQTGVELIGSEASAADVEVVLLAIETLQATGLEGLSVDLTLPGLVSSLCEIEGAAPDLADVVRDAMDSRDKAAIEAIDGSLGDWLRQLFRLSGQMEEVIDELAALELPATAAALLNDLLDLAGHLRAAAPDLPITIDPGESRGFHYYTGAGFTLFARGSRTELGRGGRYAIRIDEETSETAVGFSLFIDSLLRALPRAEATPLVYAPPGTAPDVIAALRNQGWRVVRGLEDDAGAEAKRLNCGYIIENGDITRIKAE